MRRGDGQPRDAPLRRGRRRACTVCSRTARPLRDARVIDRGRGHGGRAALAGRRDSSTCRWSPCRRASGTARTSAASRRCSRCSTRAPAASASSTSTTASARRCSPRASTARRGCGETAATRDGDRRRAGRRVIGYLDCSTGVSGDKFLGALLDVGSADGRFTDEAPRATRWPQLAPEARVARRAGAVARRRRRRACSVEAAGESPSRTWRRHPALLETAELPPRCATARSRVRAPRRGRGHGPRHRRPTTCTSTRSARSTAILDVVGVCAGLHASASSGSVASPVAIGWGTVETSHGMLPRARARDRAAAARRAHRARTGAPDGAPAGELTTPTGAALLAGSAPSSAPARRWRPSAVGYGAGTRDIGSPNVCRLIDRRAARPAPRLGTERRRAARDQPRPPLARAGGLRRRAAARRGRARRLADARS